MILKINTTVLILLALLLAAGGCSLSSDPEDADTLDAEFLSFDLLTSDNGTNLTTSVSGILGSNTVSLYSVDSSVGSYQLIPSYSTNAVSVEVDGESQQSGVSSQDFSNPVVYTLTDSAGKVNQISAELFLGKDWGSIVASFNGYSLKSGLLNSLTPYFCFYNTLTTGLDPHYYDETTDSLTSYGGTPPSNLSDYDICAAGGELYAVYETNAFNVEVDDTSDWSGTPDVLMASSGTRDLRIRPYRDEDCVLAAWIEDPGASASGTVTIYLNDGGWDLTAKDSGDMGNFNVRYMGMVSNGGETVYFACIMEGNPSALHLFEYNAGSQNWEDHHVDYNMNGWSDSTEILDLFYDSTEQRPVLCLAVPDDSFYYDIRFLYWDETAGSWTDKNGIQSLTGFSASEYSALSVCWYDDRPSVTRHSGGAGIVKEWDGESWNQVGASYGSSEPVQTTVIRSINDASWVFYNEIAGSDLFGLGWK